MNNLILQKATLNRPLPTKKQFQTWVDHALSGYKKNSELVIRIVDTKEITKLNKKYRKKNRPTNIISFPFELPDMLETNFLGDIIICAPVVKEEAKSQHKIIADHFAHLTIHGVLHLLGFMDSSPEEIRTMRSEEKKALELFNLAE